MNTCPNLLAGIYTITPLHCGTGQAVGAIDLPIARERHTGFPLIPATSLKGRLRDIAFDEQKTSTDQVWGAQWEDIAKAIFGPDTQSGDDGAGAVIFTDARLLAFPVRSLQAVFYWVTCPMVLERCIRDLAAASIDSAPPSAPQDRSVFVSGATNNDESDLLVLEDLVYSKDEVQWKQGGAAENPAREWAEWMSCLVHIREPNRTRLHDHVVIVPDEDFTDLVTRTTPVTARIQLTSRKTTGKVTVCDEQGNEKIESGNLWYEETLPADCLFYTLVCPQDARVGPSPRLKADEIKENLLKLPDTPIQLGGNETVGQGWCHWKWVTKKEENDGSVG